MNSTMTTLQTLIGTATLGGVLIFGITGIGQYVLAADEAPYIQDELYNEECGACHLAYPPGLLPVASWDKVMAGLEDHFGENAEIDEESATHISNYLAAEALRPGKPTVMSELLRNMPADPPLRITELPAFLDAHEIVGEQLDMTEFPDGFLSPCRDCHRQANLAQFEKERMHPGYGPPIWGGPKTQE